MTTTMRGDPGNADRRLGLGPLAGPLVGRDCELDRLRDAWAGDDRLVLVTGDAGIGKTRLVAELACEAQDAGATVLVGRCRDGGAEPYQPLVDALRPLVAVLNPPLARIFGDAGTALIGRAPTPADRTALFGALARVVSAQRARGPVLLVVDDLHRVGRSTVLALRHLVATADGGPGFLVVGLYRDASVDRAHPLAELLAGADRLTVGALSPGAVGEMVGDVDLGRRLWRHAAGNPLVVEELLRLGQPVVGVPVGLDEVVARRVDRLSPASRRVLEVAAVAGAGVGVAVVAAAAGMGDAAVTAAVRECSSAALLSGDPSRPGTCRLVHGRVQDALLQRMGPAVRVRLHLHVAEAIERLGPAAGASAAELAWHFRAAAPVGGSTAALAYSVRAGERAMEQLGWDEAAAHFGHALAAACGVRPPARAELLFALGDAQRLAGEPARARQAFLEAAAAARSCGDGARLARAARVLGDLAAVWGVDPVLDQLAAEAGSLLGQESPAATMTPAARATLPSAAEFASDALYDLLDGVHHQLPDNPEHPAPAGRRAGDPGAPGRKAGDPGAPGRRAGDPGGGAALLRARHLAMAGPEHTPDRLSTATDVVALAAETGDDELAATGRGWRLVDLLELGRLDEAFADQDVHAALARHRGDARHRRDAAAWVAMRALLEGRPADARGATQEALVLGTQAHDPDALAGFWTQRWWTALEWGTPDELVEVTEACRDQASTAQPAYAWRSALALVLARRGRLELAAEELRRSLDHGLGQLGRDPARLHPLTCLAEVAWILGDSDRAALLAPLLEPFADRWVVVERGLACRGSVARACGLVAAASGRWDDAHRHLDAALVAHRRLGALPLLARTQYEWARVLAGRGRRSDARRGADVLRKAVDLGTRLDMGRLLVDTAGVGLL